MNKSRARLQRQFEQIEAVLPSWAGRMLAWIRRPSAIILRIPLGILLVIGGILSFLPVLGIWMLPLGLMLLAVDIPFLQGPVGWALVWGRRKWELWRRKRAARKAA